MMKREKRKKWMTSTPVTTCTMATVLMLSSLFVGCGKKQQETNAIEPVRVKEMTAGTGDSQTLSSGYNYSGTVEEDNGTYLSFTVGGVITQLKVKVGDRVRKGQLIATVDPTTIRASYDMAHATRMQAEDAFKRMKQLHDKGSLPEMKWVEAQSQLQQTIASENIAAKSLGDCNLYAPHDGVISDKNAEVGQNAAPVAPIVIPAHLVQLADDNSNFIWLDEGGKAVRRVIVCGEYSSNGVSIVSGLKSGDKVIVEGQQKVSTGTAIKTK